jgi:hypothetical protein
MEIKLFMVLKIINKINLIFHSINNLISNVEKFGGSLVFF